MIEVTNISNLPPDLQSFVRAQIAELGNLSLLRCQRAPNGIDFCLGEHQSSTHKGPMQIVSQKFVGLDIKGDVVTKDLWTLKFAPSDPNVVVDCRISNGMVVRGNSAAQILAALGKK